MSTLQRLQTTPAEVLEPYRAHLLRSFLHNCKNPLAELALWDVVYSKHSPVSHDVAVAVGQELARSDKTIADVLDGWRT